MPKGEKVGEFMHNDGSDNKKGNHSQNGDKKKNVQFTDQKVLSTQDAAIKRDRLNNLSRLAFSNWPEKDFENYVIESTTNDYDHLIRWKVDMIQHEKQDRTFETSTENIQHGDNIPEKFAMTKYMEEQAYQKVLTELNQECSKAPQNHKTILYRVSNDIVGLATGGTKQALEYKRDFPENIPKAEDLIYKIRNLNKFLVLKDFQINNTHKKLLD